MSDPRNHSGQSPAFSWRQWQSADGLTLQARDYHGDADRPAIVCLPGLTRNSRDFAALAARLAGNWRVVAPDFRGRGKSEYAKDPLSYQPQAYAEDTLAMLDALDLDRVVLVGTSLGGIVAMLLTPVLEVRLAGAVLNDVGPELDPAGLARIRNYVGRGQALPTWLHAARALAETQAPAYPGYALEDWLAMAKRLYRLNSQGRIVLDYDMKIAEPFRVAGGEAPAGDLWPLFDVLAERPLLVVRGGLSDVLAAPVAARMAAGAAAELVTIPEVGHAPTLDEPAATTALDRLLARVEPAAR